MANPKKKKKTSGKNKALVGKKLPESLFKYFPPARIGFFTTPCLRFTPFQSLNDPFECAPAFKYMSPKLLKSIYNKDKDALANTSYAGVKFEDLPANKKLEVEIFVQARLADLAKELDKPERRAQLQSTTRDTLLKSEVGILSLTEKHNNLLMWAHYAQEHKGFVVEFNTLHSFFDQRLSTSDMFRMLRSVVYSKKRPAHYLVGLNKNADLDINADDLAPQN